MNSKAFIREYKNNDVKYLQELCAKDESLVLRMYAICRARQAKASGDMYWDFSRYVTMFLYGEA